MGKKLKKLRWSQIISLVPAILFLAYVLWMALGSFPGAVHEAIKSTSLSGEGFVKVTSDLEGVMQENFYKKEQYIHLNGLVTRVLGINNLNNRQKLANGYVAAFDQNMKTGNASKNVIALAEFLEERNIPFVYTLVPRITDMHDVEYAPGYGGKDWDDIAEVIDKVSKAGVDHIDMKTWFAENGWGVEDVFFKTDHHWKPQAALAAARCTMEYLSAQGISGYQEQWLLDEQWDIAVYEDLFLSSNGERTGALYAGVDDFPVYTPKFETDYQYSGLLQTKKTWLYYDNLLDMSQLTRNYFKKSSYNMYMYSDYPIRTTVNRNGYNDQRVLLMGDSYKKPYEYFLTTQFKEVYTIDLRYYTDGTLVQYLEEIQPDLVIMCHNTSMLTDKELFEFGIDKYREDLEATDVENAQILEIPELSLNAIKAKNHFAVVCGNLEPNQTYTLTVDSTSLEGGKDWYVQMGLQNLSTNKVVESRFFDANSEEPQKWIFTTPESVSGNYTIYLYAGVRNCTSGVAARVQGIKLYKGVIED